MRANILVSSFECAIHAVSRAFFRQVCTKICEVCGSRKLLHACGSMSAFFVRLCAAKSVFSAHLCAPKARFFDTLDCDVVFYPLLFDCRYDWLGFRVFCLKLRNGCRDETSDRSPLHKLRNGCGYPVTERGLLQTLIH